MAIPFKRYINTTSGVIGASAVAQRELLARLFTTNELLPTGGIAEFDSPDSVGDYFGTSSEEYKRAVFYFGYKSPSITRPKNIAFARWANTDVGARIFGDKVTADLAKLKAVNAGAFDLSLGANTANITGLDFSSAASLANVATAIQTKIQAAAGTFKGVLVTFNAVAGWFELDSGNTGDEVISFTDGAQTPLALIGFNSKAIVSNGVGAQEPVDVMSKTTGIDNNFGSFLFMPILTQDQYKAVATWNASQDVMFQFMVPVTAATADAMSTELLKIAGTALTLVDTTNGEYPEMCPMMILAATNYADKNAVQSYMFRQFAGLTPLVNDGTDAALYDGKRINYYGRTQTAGQFIDFYQRGFLCGLSTDPINMNTYANEQWLKDRLGSLMMNLLITLGRLPANADGRGKALSVIASVVSEALDNGTISPGREFSIDQKIAIKELTGDDLAHVALQNKGYWTYAEIRDFTLNKQVQKEIAYTLVYAKDDVVRRVSGRHALV
ncbi:DUF3383 domain-containing protein [Vibrio harveyi]|uniref:DUF3383 domain-containing protein n=1 Tax=Vibrio harveyi TaxID=669 RepID=UPI00237E40A9|nr:DUF3383 domain-containing protein [Vibrio harveyi]HDM8061701.1 DUF3383 domain-containing protein [Vibrio harveyi]